MHISGIKPCFAVTCNHRRNSQGEQGETKEKGTGGATSPRKDERSESFERILKIKMNGLRLQEDADKEAIKRGDNPL
jgi:hypothetical protein